MDPDESVVPDNRTKQDTDIDNTDNSAALDFLINAVKTQDDSIRQVMSITGLIIGAYATVVANNYDEISDAIHLFISHVIEDMVGPFYAQIHTRFDALTITFISIPLLIWLFALVRASKALHPTSPTGGPFFLRKQIGKMVLIPERKITQDFLAKLINIKYQQFIQITSMLLFGLLVLLYGAMSILSY